MHYYSIIYALLFCTPLNSQPPFPYDLSRAELVGELDNKLEEISGLSLNGDELLAIQDEDGIVFRLSLTDGSILETINFGDEGDYEGVERVGDYIYVLKSSGTLYRIGNIGTTDRHVDKFNGFLNGDNDVEGLAYDRAGNRLLLACKAPAISPDARHIYAFDLATHTFNSEPVVAVTKAEIQGFLASCNPTAQHAAICDFFSEEDRYRLGPSALAIHPTTGQYYLTSSRGKLLVVMSPRGRIQHVFRLDTDYFPQPEGLAFGADGSLYISTEAKGGEDARVWRVPTSR